jgi:hypothetical protein
VASVLFGLTGGWREAQQHHIACSPGSAASGNDRRGITVGLPALLQSAMLTGGLSRDVNFLLWSAFLPVALRQFASFLKLVLPVCT